MVSHFFIHFPFIVAEVVALEYENKRHFQSALMRSDRNRFVESNGGGGDDMTNGGGAGEDAEGAHAHMNGTAAGSNFDAPRTPIIFMLGEQGNYCQTRNALGISVGVHTRPKRRRKTSPSYSLSDFRHF